MTLMQTGLMGVTWVIAGYRERLVLKRILTTSFPPLAFLAGLVARFTIVNLIQVLVIFLVGTYVFGARTVGSVLSLASCASSAPSPFWRSAFAISTLAKTPEAAGNLGTVVNFPMLFMSGTFWPRETLPDDRPACRKVMPLTPLVDAMRGVGASETPSVSTPAGSSTCYAGRRRPLPSPRGSFAGIDRLLRQASGRVIPSGSSTLSSSSRGGRSSRGRPRGRSGRFGRPPWRSAAALS